MLCYRYFHAPFLVILLLASRTLGADPVKVLVCTEALCPDCEEFLQRQVVPAYSQLGPEVIDLKLVPYGNVRHASNGTIECQHGIGECDANVYELCAIHANPSPGDYLPFIDCLTHVLPRGRHDQPFDPQIFHDCAESSNLWWSRIQACHDIPQVVDTLLHQADMDTPSDHQYVPWIVIDGDHLDAEEQDKFKIEICKAFVAKGGSHPACNDLVNY